MNSKTLNVVSSVNSNPLLRVGIVAGETSGDLLAADLLQCFKLRGISFVAEGIAGPEMQKQGCRSLFPMEILSVMGLGEVIKQLPQLLRIRRQLIYHFITNPPDIFIGVDAPEFNIVIEKKLKQHGVLTVHYVSPSVWAWRRWRLKKIAQAVDLMLTLFPFEKKFYQEHHIPVECVGHPFADVIPLTSEGSIARRNLALPESAQIIAILPGSRGNEINYLGQVFLETALRCQQTNPALCFIAAMVNKKRAAQFAKLKKMIAPKLPIIMVEKRSREVMAAANVVLLASGTATLEAMLLKKPMVVAYKMSMLSYFMANILVKVDNIALPNLLANRTLVPEFIQGHATSENLANALFYYLNNSAHVVDLQRKFLTIHQQLRSNASEKAVTAILILLNK